MASFHERLTEALAGHYAIEEELGEGGMATVYRATEVKHDRTVAVKVLKPELAAMIGADRFLHEVRITARLHHPHILPLHDSGEADGLLYYVMPLVDGESVGDRMAREGPLPISDALRIARDVASALAHAHEQGIIHRDIKPANILLESGTAVLADFGVARMADGAMEERLTATGMAVGTPIYMSPEQSSGMPVDGRSDVYALGCVLYEMLAGDPPYTGSSLPVVATKRMTDPLPSVRRFRAAIPPEVEEVVTRSLQYTAADRYQTAAEFADALETVLNRVEAGLSGSAPTMAMAEGPPTGGAPSASVAEGAGRRYLKIVAGAAVLVTLGVLGWRIAGSGSPDVPVLGDAVFTPVTRTPGAELFPSISPDASRMVYAREGVLVLHDLTTGQERRLTEDPELADTQPALSPDGSSVAFVSARDGGGIFLLDLGTGAVRRLTNFGHNPAWSPDGTRLVFAFERVVEPSTRRGVSNLFILDVSSGTQRQLGEMDAVQPSWSPDGRRIAFWSVMRDGRLTGQRDIWTMGADGSNPVRVTDDPAVDWSPSWSADGRFLLFSSDRGGSMNVWSVAIDPETGAGLGDPMPVTRGGTGSQEHVTVAAAGLGLFVERRTTSNIWRVPFDPEGGRVTGEPIPVTEGSNMLIEPSVSPDGRQVTFFSIAEPMDIHVASVDGSSLRILESPESHDRSPQWSPDGNWIAFHSDREGGYQIWATDPLGRSYRRLTSSSAVAIYPFWAPDARRVGFVELGRGLASVDPEAPESGAETLLRGDILVRPQWSPDGSRIAGVYSPAAGGAGIVVADPETGARETAANFGDAPQWLPDSRRLVFVSGSRIHLLDVDSKDVRELLELAPDVLGLGSLSRDGDWLYFSRTVTEADIWQLDWR